MSELLWLLTGAALAVAVLRPWRKRPATAAQADDAGRPTARPLPAPPATAAPTPAASPLPLPRPVRDELRQLARQLGDELANLVSGAEGRAHHLITAAPHRAQLPAAAEAMLAALARLRTLHRKVVAIANDRRAGPGSTDLPAVVALLGEELQQLQLGLEVRWEPAAQLPKIAADPHVVHDALLFLGAALLRAERGATLLTIGSETCFAGALPWLQIELALEWRSEVEPLPPAPGDDPAFTLDLEAAHQLIALHGGELQLHHLRGRSVRAVVRWPACIAGAEVDDQHPAAAHPVRHDFGGALVLESDPAVRAMLSNELKATGRAVFACADGASARSFLEATPDRFELLIVDDPQRLDGGDALAGTIRSVAPGLKICVLAAAPAAMRAAWPDLHQIEKPFGVHELRRALASVLAAG